MTAICEICGTDFHREPSETWKRLCVDCWKQAKADELAVLREENDRLTDDLAEAHTALAARPEIDRLMLRRLVQLCHPDKHGGSEASHNATAWLLEMMREAAK